jgi:hypothetical protein
VRAGSGGGGYCGWWCRGLGSGEEVRESEASAGYPGADSADRAAELDGCLVVRVADDLGEEEGLAAFGGESVEQVGEGDPVVEARKV